MSLNYYDFLGIAKKAVTQTEEQYKKEIDEKCSVFEKKWSIDRWPFYQEKVTNRFLLNIFDPYTEIELAQDYTYEQFESLNARLKQARSTLTDTEKRKQYDREMLEQENNKKAVEKNAAISKARQAIIEGDVQAIREMKSALVKEIKYGSETFLKLIQEAQVFSSDEKAAELNAKRKNILSEFYQLYKRDAADSLEWQMTCRQITSKEHVLVKITEIETEYLKPIHHFDTPYQIIMFCLLGNDLSDPRVLSLASVMIERSLSPPVKVRKKYQETFNAQKELKNNKKIRYEVIPFEESIAMYIAKLLLQYSHMPEVISAVFSGFTAASHFSEKILIYLFKNLSSYTSDKHPCIVGIIDKLLQHRKVPYKLSNAELTAHSSLLEQSQAVKILFALPDFLMRYSTNRIYIDSHISELTSTIEKFCDSKTIPLYLQPLKEQLDTLKNRPTTKDKIRFMPDALAKPYLVFYMLVRCHNARPDSLPNVIAQIQANKDFVIDDKTKKMLGSILEKFANKEKDHISPTPSLENVR